MNHDEIRARLRRIPVGARRDLLRLLVSPSNVQADAIRQFHKRGLDLAEVLIDLEVEDALRVQVIELLRELP
jgi:hypothetical protein